MVDGILGPGTCRIARPSACMCSCVCFVMHGFMLGGRRLVAAEPSLVPVCAVSSKMDPYIPGGWALLDVTPLTGQGGQKGVR